MVDTERMGEKAMRFTGRYFDKRSAKDQQKETNRLTIAWWLVAGIALALFALGVYEIIYALFLLT